MSMQPPTAAGGATPSYPPCVEHGIWTPIPAAPPSDARSLTLREIDPDESHTVKQRGVMTFHTVGCSGDFKDHVPGLQVAKAMAAQISDPRAGGGSSAAVAASFLYHLGALVYKDEDPSDPDGKDQALMYNSEFYAQYTSYGRNIFAIAGNHDSKSSDHKKKSAIDHFLQNFCDSKKKTNSAHQT